MKKFLFVVTTGVLILVCLPVSASIEDMVVKPDDPIPFQLFTIGDVALVSTVPGEGDTVVSYEGTELIFNEGMLEPGTEITLIEAIPHENFADSIMGAAFVLRIEGMDNVDESFIYMVQRGGLPEDWQQGYADLMKYWWDEDGYQMMGFGWADITDGELSKVSYYDPDAVFAIIDQSEDWLE